MPDLTNFASRENAAYITGSVLPAGITNSRDMLALIDGQDWDVRLRELVTDARTTKTDFEVIRTNPLDGGIDRLGIAGERYGVLSNEIAFGMFDDLKPEWEAGGTFRGGRMVYGQVKTGESILVDPNGAADEIKPFAVITTTHDSSGAVRIGRTALRLDCLNMFNAMFGNLQHAVTLRHTLTIESRMKAIRLAWKTNAAWNEALKVEANALFAKKCTNKQYFDIVASLIGDKPDDNVRGRETKWENNRELFAQAWNGTPNEKVKGTAWGAFQAVTERLQWGRKPQNTDNGLENFAMVGMGLDEGVNRTRQNVLELVRAL